MSVQPARAKQPSVSADDESVVRVAVVGCGYWGPNVIRNFSSLPDAELHATCDTDPDRLQAMHRRFPAAVVFEDFAAVLRDPRVDAVAICTPVHSHYGLAEAALSSGKHVLVEKPLSHSVKTAKALVEQAECAGLTLMTDHTFVYSGAVRKIKSIIDSGVLGDLLYFDSVRINLGLFQHDVNVIWDLAPHDLSIMQYLLGRDPVRVSAIGCTHFGKLENMAYLTMMFDSNLIAHLHVNWLAPVKIRSTVIGGSKSMIVYDDLAPSEKVKVYDKGVTLNGSATDRDGILIDYRTGDMFAPKIDKTEPLLNVCRHFVDSIRNSTPPLTDGRAGLGVVRILEAAQRSIDRGSEIVAL